MEKGCFVGEGNTAEVYTWGENEILKLFRKEFNKHGIEQEYNSSKTVEELGLPVPKVGQIIEMEGRIGIIYERIAGSSMLETIIKKPWIVGKCAKRLAELHYQIHQVKIQGDGIREQKDVMKWSIQNTDLLSEEKKQEIIQLLNNLPSGKALCHGDFHPGNIIVNSDKTVVLDWMTATSGNPGADVARTLMLLKDAAIPTKIPRLLVIAMKLMRTHLASVYLKHYLQISDLTEEQIRNWRIPLAAARLMEWVPESEKALLLHIINDSN